ncbi:hypothetical protein B0H10DRAFT_2195827 [Mycena sp. CBHHK59/15]|nr:hypothetical protein B0H10DRAFT_2195827 [Mycena sp. CBHHK59/15]
MTSEAGTGRMDHIVQQRVESARRWIQKVHQRTQLQPIRKPVDIAQGVTPSIERPRRNDCPTQRSASRNRNSVLPAIATFAAEMGARPPGTGGGEAGTGAGVSRLESEKSYGRRTRLRARRASTPRPPRARGARCQSSSQWSDPQRHYGAHAWVQQPPTLCTSALGTGSDDTRLSLRRRRTGAGGGGCAVDTWNRAQYDVDGCMSLESAETGSEHGHVGEEADGDALDPAPACFVRGRELRGLGLIATPRRNEVLVHKLELRDGECGCRRGCGRDGRARDCPAILMYV